MAPKLPELVELPEPSEAEAEPDFELEPDLEPEAEPDLDSEPDLEPEPEPEPESEPEPEPDFEEVAFLPAEARVEATDSALPAEVMLPTKLDKSLSSTEGIDTVPVSMAFWVNTSAY